MAEHISIFMQNEPGKLDKITAILAEGGINIRAFSIASSGEFGILKMLLDDSGKAFKLLSERGLTVSKRKIIVCLIDDAPGSFHKMLSVLAENNMNIEDSYGFLMEKSGRAAIVLETENMPDVERVLRSNSIQIMKDEEIFSL